MASYHDVDMSELARDRDGVVAALDRRGYVVVDEVELQDRPAVRLFLEAKGS